MTTVTVTINLNVTDQQCADILCTALEGGIGYWSQCRNIKYRSVDPRVEFPPTDRGAYESCEIAELNDDESDYDWKNTARVLNYRTIVRGIKRICSDPRFSHLAPKVIEDITTDNVGNYIDADLADCIVQVGLFNEIRYG